MKTPREIILERHQPDEPQLAALTPEKLAALARPSDARKVHAGFRSVLEAFWRDSIWPWRRVWAGLAAAWIAIVAINVATGTSASAAGAEVAYTNDPQAQAMLREQRKMFVQLLGPSGPADAAPSKPTGPRSEERQEVFTV